jgi:hypothetical protein
MWGEVALLITFINFGKWLESDSKRRVGSSITKLMQLSPRFATIVENNVEQRVSVDKVLTEMTISVKAGGLIPVDGIIIKGRTEIDESLLTGVSETIVKAEGEKVFGGTLNKGGHILIVAKSVGKDTVLAGIINSVRQAQTSKEQLQKLADKVSYYFVPTVIFIAILTVVLWIQFGGDDKMSRAVLAFAAVLASACPCAMGLAIPVALAVGIDRAAGLGILIKNADVLDHVGKIDAAIDFLSNQFQEVLDLLKPTSSRVELGIYSNELLSKKTELQNTLDFLTDYKNAIKSDLETEIPSFEDYNATRTQPEEIKPSLRTEESEETEEDIIVDETGQTSMFDDSEFTDYKKEDKSFEEFLNEANVTEEIDPKLKNDKNTDEQIKEQKEFPNSTIQDKISENPKLYKKIKKHFRKIFPNISVAEVDKIISQYGAQALARVVEKGIEIDGSLAFQHSIIHEYAHIYIDLLENTTYVNNLYFRILLN